MDGQLFLGLADAGQQILSTSTAQGNTEEVSLGYLPQGTYYLFVAGAYGATNPSYVLSINAPEEAIGPDRYDEQASNHTVQTASALGALSGDSTIDQLTIYSGDVAWFKFSTTGSSASANYVGLNFDPSLGLIDAELLTSNGNVIGRADDASYFESDRGVEARMPLQGEPAGTYDIVVYGLQGATSPDYALHFFLPGSTPASSPNDTPGSAYSLGNLAGINTVTAPTSTVTAAAYSVAILSSSDENWFSFSLQETPVTGDYVSITSVNGVGVLELELLDANQNVIATADTTGGAAEISLYGNPAIQVPPPPAPPPTYYVLVKGYEGATSPLYTLQINAAGGDRFEPDNSQQTAHNLNDPKAVDPNDPTVMSATAGFVHGLESWDDLSIEPDQSSTTVSGSNSSSTDDEWYSFTLYSEGLAGDYARIDYDLSLGDLVLGLYEIENNAPTLITQASTAQDFEQISLQALPAGTYDLEVSGYVGANNQAATNPDYTLTLNTPEVLAADTYEMGGRNNTLASAVNLGTIQGPDTIDDPDQPLSVTPGDVDWYEFTTKDIGDAEDSVSISYNQAAGPLVLQLDDSSGKLIPGAMVNSFGDTETISLNTLPAATYYIEVSGYEGATNPDYAVTINAPGAASPDWVNQSAPNSMESDAYPLGTVSGPVSLPSLSIQTDTSEEWFSFKIGDNSGLADSVAISFDPSAGQLSLALFNASSSNPIDSSATIGGSEVISLSGMAAGTYDVEVYGQANPDYTLTVTGPGRTAADTAVEQLNGQSNNSFAAAFDLGTTSGAESIGPLSLLNAGENDWFKFTIPSSVTTDSSDFVGIVLDDTLGDLDVKLYQRVDGPGGAVGELVERLRAHLARRPSQRHLLCGRLRLRQRDQPRV